MGRTSGNLKVVLPKAKVVRNLPCLASLHDGSAQIVDVDSGKERDITVGDAVEVLSF